jgi:anti-sigma factor RsiW
MNCSYFEQVTDAYLSGEIEGPEWRIHLDKCPSCASKLRSESDFDLVVKQAVHSDRLQTRQIEAHVRAVIRQSHPIWGRPMVLAFRNGIAAVVVFGTLAVASLGYARGRIDRSAICVDAADDHQEEIVGKAPRKWRSDVNEVAALSQRIAGDPSIPQRIAPAGYQLIGARVCLLHGKKYMHLDYSDGSKEISLFVGHQDDHKTLSARILSWFESDSANAERFESLTVGSIQKKDLSIVLVSASPIPDVQKVVEQAGSRL